MKLPRLPGAPRRRQPSAARADYMTAREHRQEAERLAYVIDDLIQSPARRTLADLIALARLHLELAHATGNQHEPNGGPDQ